MALQFVKEQIADDAIVEAKIKDEAVTNAKLAGSIANSKLSNSTVSFGGVSLALGATDATPAFDLQDATNLPTSSLTGTITNAQLAGSIKASKLLIDSANFEEISGGDNDGKLALKSGSVTNAQLDNSSVTIAGQSLSLGGSLTANTLAGALVLSQIGAPIGAVGMSNQKITGMADPTAAQDAATKAYVDSTAQGLDVKESVRAATTSNHASLANLANGNSIDGISLATNDRILVKDQDNKVENGIYIVQASGAPSRADDFKAGKEEAGAFTFVEEGTKYKGHGFVCTMGGSDVVGTDNCPWSMFSESTNIVAGVGLTQNSNAFDVSVDDSSIIVNGSNKLQIKSGGVTNDMLGGSIANAKLANSSISGVALGGTLNALSAGNGISMTSYDGSAAVSDLAVDLDGSTLSVSGSGLKIADDGVDLAQLAIRFGYDEVASTSSTGSINLSNRIALAAFQTAGAVMVMLNGQVLRDRTGNSASGYDEYVLSDNGSVTTVTLGANAPDGSHLSVRYIH